MDLIDDDVAVLDAAAMILGRRATERCARAFDAVLAALDEAMGREPEADDVVELATL